MAVTVFKTFSAGEILTASDLNSSFTQITTNGEDLAWPATKAKDMNGQELVLDADADTSITADTDDRMDFKLQGVDLFKMDGTTASAVDGIEFKAAATGSPSTVTITAQGSSTNINLDLVPKGSGTIKNNGAVIGTGDGDVLAANNGSEFTEATFKTNLNMEAGIDYQAFNSGISTTPHIQGKHTIWCPIGATRSTISNGADAIADFETTAARPDINYVALDASSDESGQFTVFMPKSWDEGTITFRAVWAANAAVSTGIAIALEGVGIADNETIDVAYGTSIVVTDDAQGAAEERLISDESSALTIGGTLTYPSLVTFRYYRDVSDGNDDMTQDMWLEGFLLHITTDAGDDT